MEDLSAKLSSLLENPAELEKVKELASTLLGGDAGAADGDNETPASGKEPGTGGMDPAALLSGLLQSGGPPAAPSPPSPPAPGPAEGLLSAISPKELNAIMRIGSALKSRQPDDRSQLLLALRPHLSPARQERVDQAVKLLRRVDIIPLLKDSGLDLCGSR